MTRPEGPHVVKLAREPSRRESRYAQLFTGQPTGQALAEESPATESRPRVSTVADSTLAARVVALEDAVAELRREFAELKVRADG